MTGPQIHDPELGTLNWNSDLDWWEGQTILIADRPLRFSVTVESDDPESDPAPEIQRTRQVVAFLREHEPEARLVAAEELLELYNAQWNVGEPLTEAEFMDRLTIDDLQVSFDGTAELYYREDGMFSGHAVLVTLDENNNFLDADIAG